MNNDTGDPVLRDERTVSVENASYRWSYLFLSYGLLILTMYRSLVAYEGAWDLLALVVAGGVVGTLYQARHQILTWRTFRAAVALFFISAVVGAGVAWIETLGKR